MSKKERQTPKDRASQSDRAQCQAAQGPRHHLREKFQKGLKAEAGDNQAAPLDRHPQFQLPQVRLGGELREVNFLNRLRHAFGLRVGKFALLGTGNEPMGVGDDRRLAPIMPQ
jgi:hypothetical protein